MFDLLTRTMTISNSSPLSSPAVNSEDEILEEKIMNCLQKKSSQSSGRDMSRSSSVPITATNQRSNRSDDIFSRAVSQYTRNNTSSVKHLTCFWWKEKRSCRFSDEDCLYAHYDTGHYTEPPRQLIPGEPALAGRKLDRAMRNIAIVHRSSGSLSSLASRQGSRPATPTYDHNSPLASPLQLTEYDVIRLNSDNQFLKALIDQNSKEKALMASTIENLQANNKSMLAEIKGLRKAQEQLLTERENFQSRIRTLEQPNFPTDSVACPFRPVGRARINTETRYLGGLLDNE